MTAKTRWYKNAVVYQIYPFSFKDGNNDGWGDIEGIISKLDHIKELGATAIWFSPLYDSPDKDFGYDIRDYRKIDKKFGTMDDFKDLLNECHKRNLRVIMDMVINHTSDQHEWFKSAISSPDSPYRDYYIIRKGKRRGNKLLPPNNWGSNFTGSAWERIGESDDFYLHLFTVEQPDLNWENPKVRDELVDILNFYMDMGVDGFRFDVFNMFSKVDGLPDDKNLFVYPRGKSLFTDGPRIHEFLHELNTRALALHDSYTVGESSFPSEENAYKYVCESSEEFDTIFTFNHLSSDSIFGLKYFKKKFNLREFKDGLFKPQLKYYNGGWNTLVLENHDNARSISRFGFNTKEYRYEISTMLPVVTFLGFGIPYIYEGEEFGMTNCDFNSLDEMKDPVSHFIFKLASKFMPKHCALCAVKYGARDHARTPVQWDDSVNAGWNEGHEPWQRLCSNYKEINAEKDKSSEKSIYKFYQQVITLKKTEETLIYGTVKEYSHNNNSVICYEREHNGKHFFVVANFKDKVVSYKLPCELTSHEYNAVLSNYDDCNYKQNKLLLQPYQAVVYTFDD